MLRRFCPCLYSTERLNDSDEVRLSELWEIDEQTNAFEYTLENRPIPYKSPHLTSHPATTKAKDAADNLNEAYQKISECHQDVRRKMIDFKKIANQPEYADLATCFSVLKTRSGLSSIKLVCSDETNEPVKLIGGSDKIEDAVRTFNEMLDACHEFLGGREGYLEEIRRKVRALRLLAVMQQILDICSTFEEQATANIDIFATEIHTLLLDVKSAAKLVLK